MKQNGYTLVEIAVAVSVLAAGSAVLWYGIRSSAKIDKLNRLHHAAVAAAVSDLEGLRGRVRKDIHDTAYGVSGPAGEGMRVVRQVFDSAKIVAAYSELTLDENMSPKELRKPLEVRVRVFRAAADSAGGARASYGSFSGEAADAGSGDAGADSSRAPLASLILKLPEYLWY